MSVSIGERVAVCGDDAPKSPAVVIEVDRDADEAVVVFEVHDPGVWVDITDDRMRREVVEVLHVSGHDYFDKVPTSRYPLDRVNASLVWYDATRGGGSA